ncbi:hypothetical protein FPV67DRAFT_1458634 [Lyophyllum atratum]|nr:hypothetical protein FPV67DRAFT_1458634 [Lyophyllum atratum]
MQPTFPPELIHEVVHHCERTQWRELRFVSPAFRRVVDAVFYDSVELNTKESEFDPNGWPFVENRELTLLSVNRHIPPLVRRAKFNVPDDPSRLMDPAVRDLAAFSGVTEVSIIGEGWGCVIAEPFFRELLRAANLVRVDLVNLDIPLDILLGCTQLKHLALDFARVTEATEQPDVHQPWSGLDELFLFNSRPTMELENALRVGSGVRELRTLGCPVGECNRLVDILKGSLRSLEITKLHEDGEVPISCVFGAWADCSTVQASSLEINGATLLEDLRLGFVDSRSWESIPAILEDIGRLPDLRKVEIRAGHEHNATEEDLEDAEDAEDSEDSEDPNPWRRVDDVMFTHENEPTLKIVVIGEPETATYIKNHMPQLDGQGRLEVRRVQYIFRVEDYENHFRPFRL